MEAHPLTRHFNPDTVDHDAPDVPAARLLVVDDIEENRMLLEGHLTHRGYEVSLADGGQSALDAIAEGDFDLVLLDIMMPGIDGIETLKQLRRNNERGTLPIIMVSARNEAEDMVQALELGANDYISKPVNFPVAFARIETHLSLKRANDALRTRLGDALEREQAAAKLRESEEFVRLISDTLPLIISYFDTDKIIRFINQVAVEWYACPREDLIGKPLSAKLTGTDDQDRKSHMDRVLKGEPQTFDRALTFPDGKFREVTVSYIPHFDEAGKVVGFFGIVQDNSDRLEIQRQLNQAQKMDAIGQLTGGIAHDFNNIIMVTDGYTRRALKHIEDPDAVTEALAEVLTGTERAAKLTKQLLSFSRCQIIEKRVFRVEEAISEIEALLKQSTGERYELQIESHTEGACVETDASEFSQALVNLVINARDAMPKGGRIEIVSRMVDLADEFVAGPPNLEAGRFVEVSVRDYGVGIDEDKLKRIFEPFFTTKDQGKGTGLGLAMVYGFAQSSNGAVEAESAPEEGATFKIYLPAVDRDPYIIVAEVEQDHHGQGETILLVEDDQPLLELARGMLETLGYKVLTASDGFEAIEVEADYEAEIDLLLSDVVMPNMGGFEAAEMIRTARPDIKVVFMSGYPNRAGIGIEDLPDDCQFLQKPVKPAHLARILRQELDKPDPEFINNHAKVKSYDYA